MTDMNEKPKNHWVFRAHVLDRAGALTSIASAFSNEGVSIDTIVGHGSEAKAGTDGSVVLTFYCSEEDKDKMVRKISRLSKVTRLDELPYESQSLRKSALIMTTREIKPRDVVGEKAFLTSELVKTREAGWTYFLAGSPSDLDPVLERLETEGIVKDIIYSVLTL
jgi:acetolactate synthase small subunit